MKKSLLFAFLAAGLLVSCSSDDDFDDLETINVSTANYAYDADGVWTQNDKAGFLNIDDYVFSHILDDYSLVYGFTPSKVTDTSLHSPLSSFPYAAAAGGGVNGAGSPYLVGYWGEYLEGENCDFSERTCRIYAEDGDRFQPQSVMVCNTTWMKYAGLNGTDFSPKFTAGDYVTLTAHGVHLDGTVAEATFYLVNIESSDVENGILSSWQKFDLTSLGTCTGLYFTMDASASLKNDYGMTVPAYFCLDQLVVKE